METNKENQLKIKIPRLILSIILVNIIGLCLRYFNLNTYLIIFGFRLHLSLVLPFIIVFNSSFFPYIKSSLLRPEWKRYSFPLILIIFPILTVLTGLFLLQKIELGDPEYFYEFGISSIADFPIYLLWNLPQLIFFFFFLSSVVTASKFRLFFVALVISFLFTFELIPINKSIIQPGELGILISCAIIFSILINYYRNIYWFGISLFALFWLAILAFGSNSKTIINILFASQYNNWEGFFEVAKQYSPFTLPAYFGIGLIVSCIALIFTYKTKSMSER
jgi:hypothetical protein